MRGPLNPLQRLLRCAAGGARCVARSPQPSLGLSREPVRPGKQISRTEVLSKSVKVKGCRARGRERTAAVDDLI